MSYYPAKKNTAYIFYLGLVSRSTGQFQSNPTLAAGDFKVSIDGGALNNLATLPTVTPAASKMVKISLSAAEMNGDNIVIVGSDVSGAEWDDVISNIQTSINQIDDLSSRIPAALSANGNMKSDIKEIEDQLTSGNNATLNLKKLSIVNNDNGGNCVFLQTGGAFGKAILIDSVYTAVDIYSAEGYGIFVSVDGLNGIEIDAFSSLGDAVKLLSYAGGKSINAPQDIALPNGDLDDQLQALPTAAENTDATWGTALPGLYTSGQAGYILASRMPTGTVVVAQNNDKIGYSLSSPQVFDMIGNVSGTLTNTINVLSPVVAGVVTGSVLGNVNGSVDSVINPVGIATGSFINAVADQVWDETLADHLDVGSTGNALNAAGSAGDPWSTMLPGVYGAGTAGDIIGNRLDMPVSDVPTADENAETLLKKDWTTVVGEASRSVLNALRKLRNKVSFDGANTLTITKENDTTVAYTQSVVEDANQDPFKEVG